ncbi:MAG TPA: TrkA family potassium uptake protein, partial [Pseudonocardiaceae bacterium]|nr:TrkA family potassium uptake protein [Pseudonocardiaceae bacterium]
MGEPFTAERPTDKDPFDRSRELRHASKRTAGQWPGAARRHYRRYGLPGRSPPQAPDSPTDNPSRSDRVHVVIMGCGRVGAGLALALERIGHDVSVIDQNPQAFRRLGADFHGQSVRGSGFDRQVLIEAGIERAEAFAAVSNGDNSNIISARVARETFGVAHVVARIY